MKRGAKIYTALIFMFLFAPIVVMIVFSFNSGSSTSVMEGFSFKWYEALFNDSETLNALKNTLILAICASVISTILGTLAALGIDKMKNKYTKQALMMTTNIPMMNPEIITGISMMLLFVFVGRILGLVTSLSFGTMLIAHVTFCLPYVILAVLPKLKQMDKSLPEAALDLGCTPLQSFFKVELHAIMPGILTGFLMAFTLSLDDFVISYFTSGTDFQTLPLHIFSMTKKSVKPTMYALGSLIFIVVFVLLLLSNNQKSADERMKEKQLKEEKKRRDAIARMKAQKKQK